MSTALLLLLPFLAYSQDPVWPVPPNLWLPEVENLPTTDNYVYFKSSCGSAGTALYTPATAYLTVHVTSRGEVQVHVNGDEVWTLIFETAQRTIRKGYYEHADAVPRENSNSTGVFVYGSGRGQTCTIVGGWFAVDSVTYQGETLAALEIRFEANRGKGDFVKGAVHWSAHSTSQAPGPIPTSPDLWAPPANIVPKHANFAYIALPTTSQVYTYTSPQAFIYIEAHQDQMQVRVVGEEQWSGSFRTMRGLSRLQPGYYGDLVMTSHFNPVRGGMTWGLWQECHQGSGWYAVDSIEFDSGNLLQQVALRFGHVCKGQEAPVYGAIYWHASNPVNPTVPTSVPEDLWTPPAALLAGNSLYLQSQGDLWGNWSRFEANWTDAVFQVREKAGELLISVEGEERWRGIFRDADSERMEKAGFYGFYRYFMSSVRQYSGFKWEGLLATPCPTYEGWYVIDEISYSDGSLSLLRLRFEQFCGQYPYSLQGALYWASSSPQRHPAPVQAPPLGLWTPPNLPEIENFLYLESEDEEMVGGSGHIGCVLSPSNSRFEWKSSLKFSISCQKYWWEGVFTPRADQSQLEKGYYGDLVSSTDYFNPLKGTFSFSREGSGTCIPRTGWFAVDQVSSLTSVVLRFETKCWDKPALKGYLSWNSATIQTSPTCAYGDYLWQPSSLPPTASFLHLEDQYGTTLAQYTGNITVSWLNSVLLVGTWTENGRLQGSFQLNSELAEGCYDGGVCWAESCASAESWCTVDRVERQGGRLSRLELRFEQRSGEVLWRGALQWADSA